MNNKKLKEIKMEIMDKYIEKLEKEGVHEINTTDFVKMVTGIENFNKNNLVLASKSFNKRDWLHIQNKKRKPSRIWVYLGENRNVWKY